jgi:lysophospholipase
MNITHGNIRYETAADGMQLRIGHWPAAAATRRIVLCHGRTEFLEKYSEVISELNDRNFDVWSMDWRGQGLSGRSLGNPQKGHIGTFTSYIDDLAWLIDTIGSDDPAGTVLMGHSMGGHIVLRALLEGRVTAGSAVLTAPMVDLPMRRLRRAAITALCRTAKMTGLGGRYVTGLGNYDPAQVKFGGNPLSHDPTRFGAIHAAIAATPGVEMGGPTFGWLDAAFRSIGVLHSLSRAPRNTCPILLCTAMADTVVSVDAQHTIASALPTCSQHLIEGAAHEILHETDAIRDGFWNAFDGFIAG